MNTKLQMDRDLASQPNRWARFHEAQLKSLQLERGIGREEAAKLSEYYAFLAYQVAFNGAVGLWAAKRFRPIHAQAAKSYALFAKGWMGLPLQLGVFWCAYYAAGQLQTRTFPKFSWKHFKAEGGVSANTYQGNHDLVSKFRFFEGTGAEPAAQDSVESYIQRYTQGPSTRQTFLSRVAEGSDIEGEDLFQRFRIRRDGKDKNDQFWSLGKIHGLEYIAHCTEEEINSTGGDPIKL